MNAAGHGVPQSRERVFFIGVREDLGIEPCFPLAMPGRPKTAGEALVDVPPGTAPEIGPGRLRNLWEKAVPGEMFVDVVEDGRRYAFNHWKLSLREPAPTITQTAQVYHPYQPRLLTIPEVRRLCSFPDDYELTGSFRQQWEALGRAVPPLLMRRIATALRGRVFAKEAA